MIKKEAIRHSPNMNQIKTSTTIANPINLHSSIKNPHIKIEKMSTRNPRSNPTRKTKSVDLIYSQGICWRILVIKNINIIYNRMIFEKWMKTELYD